VTTSPDDYTGQLLSYLQAWRQYLEQTVRGAASGASFPTSLWPTGPLPPPPPATSPGPPTAPAAAPGASWPTAPWPATPVPPGAPVPTPSSFGPGPAPAVAAPFPPGAAAPGRPAASDLPRAPETSSAGAWQGDPPDPTSLFGPELTTPASAPVTDSPPASAYPWAGNETGPGIPTSAAGPTSLYPTSTGSAGSTPLSAPGRTAGPSPSSRLQDPARIEIIGADPPA
jgi:hypothetical protein